MKYSAVGGGASNGSTFNLYNWWRYKSTTLKGVFITLFLFTALFFAYQLMYFMDLTEYQSKESHNRQLELLGSGGTGKGAKSSVTPEKLQGVQQEVVGVGGNRIPGKAHFSKGNERKKGKPLLSSRIIGVRPTDLHFYQEQGRRFFKCLSTHKQISWEKVNDDYCDCPLDGSDEPSTSACMNGKFYCLKKDGIKDFIQSSRVNDGVCDCLDGTDEHASHVLCKALIV